MKWTKVQRQHGSADIKACPGRDESEPSTWLIIRAALSLERYFYPGVQRAGALGVPPGDLGGGASQAILS